jgi:hypothetical protein
MKLKPAIVALLVLIGLAAIADAQTVVITPRKITYRRPKPQIDFKRTFTVRRPIARAATPALSRKITTAISPEKVLELNIKEELSEYQWLEEADYKVLFNENGILCIEQWMTGTAAYPDDVTRRVVVDIATGNVVTPDTAFSNLTALAKLVRKKQLAEIASATAEIKKEDPETDPKDLFAETNFNVEDFKDFSVDLKGVTFYYDYGFPHAIVALQPSGEFHFSWSELKPYIKTGGLLARFVR